VAGALFLVEAFLEDSAPKQAASDAIAVAFAVIPCCLARAVSELSGLQAEGVAEREPLWCLLLSLITTATIIGVRCVTEFQP
jgi:hypothetical protein